MNFEVMRGVFSFRTYVTFLLHTSIQIFMRQFATLTFQSENNTIKRLEVEL